MTGRTRLRVGDRVRLQRTSHVTRHSSTARLVGSVGTVEAAHVPDSPDGVTTTAPGTRYDVRFGTVLLKGLVRADVSLTARGALSLVGAAAGGGS